MKSSDFRPIIGESTAVKAMNSMIAKVAPTKTNVLIIGESGTGKELVARTIHEIGPLKGKPFVPVNCGAIPENLIESELFGHKRGSFTGAVADKNGLFEVANGGTLFLDEVGELPLGMQVKLLRAIQDRTIRKIGATQDQKIDVRLIAATNRDLEAAVAKGTFREDLYYRLNVILIKTPPLRERKGDITILAHLFLEKFSKRAGRRLNLDTPALQALESYSWPGNVRELENIIERSVALANDDKLTIASLPAEIAASSGAPVAHSGSAMTGLAAGGVDFTLPEADFGAGKLDLDAILQNVERHYVSKALEHTKGARKAAADLLGITFRSFRYRLSKLGVAAAGDDAEEGDED